MIRLTETDISETDFKSLEEVIQHFINHRGYYNDYKLIFKDDKTVIVECYIPTYKCTKVLIYTKE